MKPIARRVTLARLAVATAALIPALFACGSHPLSQPVPNVTLEAPDYTELSNRREIDLIFMVDNSFSMEQEQDNLARNFPSFMRVLEGIDGGLPDVRIAVISSDVGAAGAPVGTCRGLGDGGKFQIDQVILEKLVSRKTDVNCGLQDGAWWITASASGTVTNLAPGKTLAQVFSCMAQRGIGFCGYEHQLESVRRALAPEPGINAENTGFLRKDALLGIVIITDEDDCSAPPDATAFFMSQIEGQAASYRCATEGHLCNGQAPPASGAFSTPLASCRPNPGGRLRKISELVDAVKAAKPGKPDKIFVAAIAGWPTEAQMANATYKTFDNREQGGWDLGEVCKSANGTATPALRINEFVRSFGDNGLMQSICQDELAPALDAIAEAMKKKIPQTTCIDDRLADGDLTKDGLQPTCVVSEERVTDGKTISNPVSRCDAGARPPCFRLEEDATCGGSGWKYVVDRGGAEPPLEARLVAKCLTCARPDQPGCR